MNDAERCRMLEDFANDHSIAKGGNIKVTVSEYSTHFQPREGYSWFKHEDSKLLDEILTGATHFMYWLGREGFEIRRKRMPSKANKH